MEGMKGGIDVISFLTKSDPPLLTAADICDIDIVSFLMESYTHENWESTNDFFLEVMNSLLQLEPRAVKPAIKMLPDFNEHFLGEIVKIFVDAGLRIGLGGEYGIGGLFLPSGTSENDLFLKILILEVTKNLCCASWQKPYLGCTNLLFYMRR